MRHTLPWVICLVLGANVAASPEVNPYFVPERTFNTGGAVFYPAAVLSGIAAVGYGGRLIPAALGALGVKGAEGAEGALLIPFGGSYLLFGGIEKLVLVAQHVRLRRLHIDSPVRPGVSLGLYGLTAGLYAGAVATSINAAFGSGADLVLPGVLLVGTSAMMVVSAIVDLKAFRVNEALLLKAGEERRGRRVSVMPVVGRAGDGIGAGLVLTGGF